MAAFEENARPLKTLNDVPASPTSTTVHSQGIEAFKDVVFGSTAGILGKYVEYPFDTVKVRLQSRSSIPGAGIRLEGPLHAFRAAFHSPEGPIRNLYRGISAPLLGAAIETSSLFFSYRIAQEVYISASPQLSLQKQRDGKVDLPLSALVACGAASGAFTSLLLTPIELVKCKMQVPITPTQHAALGPLQIISQVYRTQGILGFWHGQLGTLIRETGGSAAWFGSYELTKLFFRTADPTVQNISDVKVWQQMLGGAIAGMSYNFVFYPADTIKSRMQTEETKSARKTNFMETATELWRQNGVRGFYRGCGITVFRAAPSSAIIFSIYEALKKHFG